MGNCLSTMGNAFCCGRSTSPQATPPSSTHNTSSHPLSPLEPVDALSAPSTSNPQQSQSDHNKSEIDLDTLIHHIDNYLSALNQASPATGYPSKFKLSDLVGSTYLKDFSTLFDGISKGAQMLYDEKEFLSKLLGAAQKDAMDALKAIGHLHWAAAGLLVLAHVVERFETISSNQKECLELLNTMSDLAKSIRPLKDPELDPEMKNKMFQAVTLIAKGAIACCSQMQMKKGHKVLLASKNAEDLVKLRSEIDRMYSKLNLQVGISALLRLNSGIPQKLERPYPKSAVGIEEQVKRVTDLLELESQGSAVAVVVYGFGGAGKTTFADAVVATLKLNGYKYSRIELNKNLERSPNITELQATIVTDLTGQKRPDIRDIRSGQQHLDSIIQREPVFIYIDNVLEKYALKQLLPESLHRSKKIRLLLTARNKIVSDALQGCSVRESPLDPLSQDSAMKLLSRRVEMETLNSEERNVVNEIAEKCRSSPLILELIGGYLQRRGCRDYAFDRVRQWLQKGDPFGSNPEDQIFDSMFSLAFKALEENTRDAFVDICSFFYGWTWNKVECILGTEELETLEELAFVQRKLDTDTVGVHDVFIAKGRGLAGDISEGLRLKSTQEVREALEHKEKANKIKGIWISENKDRFELSAQILDQMHGSLRVLALGDWTSITDGKCNKTFPNLRYFHAGDVPCLPFDISKLEKLRFLHNYSGQDMGLHSLMIPQTLGVVELSRRNHCRMVEIHPQTFGKLTNLRSLELHGFLDLKLEMLPAFSKLTDLNLSECGVVEFPNSLGNLRALQNLNLRYFRGLKKLPECIGELRNLKTLDLRGCTHLKQLPENFGLLSALVKLDLSLCDTIEELPQNFGSLRSLKFLNLNWCTNLKELPSCFGNLASLVELDLTSCTELRSLPHSIGHLTSLSNSFGMSDCSRLTEIAEEFSCLTFLEDLDLEGCKSLGRLPQTFSKLTNLRKLSLSRCESLLRLPDGFYKLSCLEMLDLNGCSHLEELCSEFERIPWLRSLDLSGCKSLNGIWMECVAKIQSLKSLCIDGSYWLQKQWKQIKNEREEWHFSISTWDEQLFEDGNITESPLTEASSVFFSDECLLVDGNGKQVSPASTFFPYSRLVLLFGPRPRGLTFETFQWVELSNRLKSKLIVRPIIYIDRGQNTGLEGATRQVLNELPEGSLGLPASTNAGAILVRTWEHRMVDDQPCMIGTIVKEDDEGHKRFSKWADISYLLRKELIRPEIRRRYRLIKRPVAVTVAEAQGCNIELLRAFLVTEKTDFLLRNNAEQVKVDDLKGKQILLFISDMEVSETKISMMNEVYLKMKNRHYYSEVVWIPVVSSVAHSTWGCYVRNATSMPWLAIPNPWSVDKAVLKFPGYSRRISSILVVVDRDGRITNENAMEMVMRWGAEAYPFTREKEKELTMAEQQQINLKSSLEFLLQNFDHAVPKVEQAQLLCLFGGDPHQISEFVSKLNSAVKGMKDSFHFVYVGRWPPYEYPHDDEEAAIHEKNREGMSWPSLSTWDAYRFWRRTVCYRRKEEETLAVEDSEKASRLNRLARRLDTLDRCSTDVWMIVLDENGDEVVTGQGKELVEELLKDGFGVESELVQSLKSSGVGGLKEALKGSFKDAVILPQHHPQHTLLHFRPHQLRFIDVVLGCDMCEEFCVEENYTYRCVECEDVDICGRCFDILLEGTGASK